jgi:putative peptidoglycan lipid II flippase
VTHATDVRRGVVRQSGLTSVAATVAIASGLVLDLSIAARFGASGDTDAFVVAARVPLGILAMLMATANQILVPTFSTWLLAADSRRTSRLVLSVLVVVMTGGLGLAGLLALLAGPLVALVAPGFGAAQQQLTSDLARVFVVVVPLTAGSEVLRAYLNARYSFVVPAAMTVVLNLVACGIVLAAAADIRVVPVAYVIGGAAQFVVMLAMAWRRGLRLRAGLALRAPELAATWRLAVRPFAASGLNPAARVVELLFASFLPPGSATILHYGNRLVSAVGGTVLFRSVIVAVMPRLSRAEAERRRDDADRLVVLGARIMLGLSLPLTAAMAVLALPATRLAFERGRFDPDSATLLGIVITVYAASFVGSAAQRALLAPFYARLDTRTPLRNTMYGVGANLALLPLVVLPLRGQNWGVVAMAAAYSLSQYVHVAHAWFRLRHDVGTDLRSLRRSAARSGAGSVVAALGMGVVVMTFGLYDAHSSVRLAVGLVAAGSLGLALVVLAEGLGGGSRTGRRVVPRVERLVGRRRGWRWA